MIYKFTEVLNDLVNYFILGDILLLESWKRANNLSHIFQTIWQRNLPQMKVGIGLLVKVLLSP